MKFRDAWEEGIKHFPRQLFDGWFHRDGAGRSVSNSYARTPCASVLGQCLAGIEGFIVEDSRGDVVRPGDRDAWLYALLYFPLLDQEVKVAVSGRLLASGMGNPSRRNVKPEHFHSHENHRTIGGAVLALNDQWRVPSCDIVDWMEENESYYGFWEGLSEKVKKRRRVVSIEETFTETDEWTEYLKQVRELETTETETVVTHERMMKGAKTGKVGDGNTIVLPPHPRRRVSDGEER